MFDWSKQVILLTGGTGSFGQKFTETILRKHPPKTLRIYSRDEYKQFEMEKKYPHKNLRFFIGDVRDEERLRRAMHDVTIVIHAAAMKQIVVSEYNPTEAIKTNIFGTMNVLNTSINERVDRVLALITDKAVSPINLYGATKLCAEKLLIQGNYYVGKQKTKISCVRYGNVAGSRGSVIPLFMQQKKTGTFTVTDKNMTRFWITLQEGVDFVLNCLEHMKGREVFIPKMPSFKIVDLVKAINSDAKIKFIGIRPGEKVHEDLITLHESRNVKIYKNFYVLINEDHFLKHKNVSKKNTKDFSYNSGTNNYFLSVKELKFLLRDTLNE